MNLLKVTYHREMRIKSILPVPRNPKIGKQEVGFSSTSSHRFSISNMAIDCSMDTKMALGLPELDESEGLSHSIRHQKVKN